MTTHNLTGLMTTLSKQVGNTPLMALHHPDIRLFAKLEFMNPVGSIKDRPALHILRKAIERGEVDRRTLVVESSSGNFASALASYCRYLGISFTPVIDPNITRGYEAFLRLTCDHVVKVTERDETGGYLLTRLAEVQRIREATPNSFWPNQYGNDDCMWAHYHGSGAELTRDLGSLDFVFLGVSSGGTIAGVSRRIKEAFPECTIVAVDVEGSVIFGGAPRKRYIPGIGASLRPSLLDQARIDEVVHVSESETVEGCLELLNRHGLFVGGSTGSVYAAIQNYFSTRKPRTRVPTVAFLCADRGTAYLDTVYNVEWVERTYGHRGRIRA